jgi:hypothetical protein
MKIAMSISKTLFKVTLYSLLIISLALAAVFFWLRYEFERAETAQPEFALAHNVIVKALAEKPAVGTDCEQQYPQKKAWFGALHVHTAASYDATAFGVSATVDDAYAFARGKALPLRLRGDDSSTEVPTLRISAPLDFMAVTDHAEALGEINLCYASTGEARNTLACRLFRGDIPLPIDEKLEPLFRLAALAVFGNSRSARICGSGGTNCQFKARLAWQENQRSTEAWQDNSSECQFSTFHAYEYSSAQEASNLHRNVVFRSSVVPQDILSAKEAPEPEQLWEWLDKACIQGSSNCDVLAIPHNSNWSSGRMWFPPSLLKKPLAQQRALAQLRIKLEPLAEIMQVKGDSECRNGITSVLGGVDEFCDFEKLRPTNETLTDCGSEVGSGGMMLKGCVSKNSYVRYALATGLLEYKKLGVNPFKFGIVAATDTHNGTPAAGTEQGHKGAHGSDRNIQHRLLGEIEVPGKIATGSPVRYNPGGIAGIYATENRRDALFSAMQNRETFGTSGPRITPRFFAGWDLPDDLCNDRQYLKTAYKNGVPMGSDLPPPRSGSQSAPVFNVSALADQRSGENSLERIQIVKAWIDESGQTHQSVYNVAGHAQAQASVNLETCEVSGNGFAQLCGNWQDPDFDASRAAVYYARVLQNPSCRWSQYDCNALPETQRPKSCSDPALPKSIQERAWTSPIWYQPE